MLRERSSNHTQGAGLSVVCFTCASAVSQVRAVAVLLAITVLSAARWCLLRVCMFVVLFALALRALLVVVC